MSYLELAKELRESAANKRLMIYAADAIEQLDKDLERAKEWASFWEEEATEALKKFQVAVASKPRWIPVTESLPEPGTPCLCWCKGGTYGQIRWYGLYYLTSHRTWAFYDNDYIDNREVTHWMYRPEPPKEEQADPCSDCRHYPPSSTDGKPCCACDPSNPLTNCHDAKEET